MNEELPNDLQLFLEEIDDPGAAKSFVVKNVDSEIQSYA